MDGVALASPNSISLGHGPAAFEIYLHGVGACCKTGPRWAAVEDDAGIVPQQDDTRRLQRLSIQWLFLIGGSKRVGKAHARQRH